MTLRLAGSVLLILSSIAPAKAELRSGFVYLAEVDGTIRQDIRYAGSHNFVGRPVLGYGATECVLTEKAARTLSKVQAVLSTNRLSLIVWDCYRPTRAVADFVKWSKTPEDARMKLEFFPNTDKSQFFKLGYLSSNSAHSRGSTVDIGIVPDTLISPPAYDPNIPLKPCTAPKNERFEDGTIDLGTGFDCLDPLASVANPNIGAEAKSNRMLLRNLMMQFGFRPYSREWWHFELVDEPFPYQSFDFPITSRAASEAPEYRAAIPFYSFWNSFKTAVLNLDKVAVVSMTIIPYEMSPRGFESGELVDELERIFSDYGTRCVAIGNVVADPKGYQDAYGISCGDYKSDIVLIFLLQNGTWRFSHSEPWD